MTPPSVSGTTPTGFRLTPGGSSSPVIRWGPVDVPLYGTFGPSGSPFGKGWAVTGPVASVNWPTLKKGVAVNGLSGPRSPWAIAVVFGPSFEILVHVEVASGGVERRLVGIDRQVETVHAGPERVVRRRVRVAGQAIQDGEAPGPIEDPAVFQAGVPVNFKR